MATKNSLSKTIKSNKVISTCLLILVLSVGFYISYVGLQLHKLSKSLDNNTSDYKVYQARVNDFAGFSLGNKIVTNDLESHGAVARWSGYYAQKADLVKRLKSVRLYYIHENENGKSRFEDKLPLLVGDLIEERALQTYTAEIAKTYGINVTSANVEEESERLYFDRGGKEAIETQLKAIYGWTIPDFAEAVKADLLGTKVAERIRGSKLSDEEVLETLEENFKEFVSKKVVIEDQDKIRKVTKEILNESKSW